MVKFLFLIIFLQSTRLLSQSQLPDISFKASDYPAPKYEIKIDSVSFSDFKIEICQTRLLIHNPESPQSHCKCWIILYKENKIFKELFVGDVDPVGGCSGLFYPDIQPRNDYFLISKFGDYSGALFIIDKEGNIISDMGGIFYVSEDKRYLFSHYDSDISGLFIYDFEKKTKLYSETPEQYFGDWYFQDNQYFTEIYNHESNNVENNRVAVFDFTSARMKMTYIPEAKRKAENKLKIYNNPMIEKECTCGK